MTESVLRVDKIVIFSLVDNSKGVGNNVNRSATYPACTGNIQLPILMSVALARCRCLVIELSESGSEDVYEIMI